MQSTNTTPYDVAIIGGGPGGTTTGTLLKKYDPKLRVVILERARFPREHIGESQLPPIGRVLDEMGVWDKVEAANFIIKLGATFTWGKTVDPWVYHFIPMSHVRDDPRPGKFEGWRTRVAFQVERAQYDEILLKHAESVGCEVRQETPVERVHHENGKVTALELANGEKITARYYVDASGNAAVMRRQLGVQVDAPTLLQNVAFWDYWEKPGLNAALLEHAAVRIQIRSVPFGWLWYIALSPDRTSVGLVCPASYYKKVGKTPEALYAEALALDSWMVKTLDGVKQRGELQRTTDWSYVAQTTYGDNWFLCGETLGFADPILSAGLTLTHTCGRHLAYTILELDRGEHDPVWLKTQYDEIQRRRVVQHMRFAEYWYSGNGFFSAIEENCAAIAQHSGLKLTPTEAFRWLATGGLEDEIGQVAIGGLDLAGVKQVQWRLSHTNDDDIRYKIHGMNRFRLDLSGAELTDVAELREGRIVRSPTYVRDGLRLPVIGAYALLIEALRKSPNIEQIMEHVQSALRGHFGGGDNDFGLQQCMQCLELMANNGWVQCSVKKGQPAINLTTPKEGELLYTEGTRAPLKLKRDGPAQG